MVINEQKYNFHVSKLLKDRVLCVRKPSLKVGTNKKIIEIDYSLNFHEHGILFEQILMITISFGP